MSYKIDPRKVAGVVVEANQAINNKGFNHGEVVLGLAELIGRVIVSVSTTPIQAQELVQVVENHLALTLKRGAEATEKSVIARA
jgi:hypothetical protein